MQLWHSPGPQTSEFTDERGALLAQSDAVTENVVVLSLAAMRRDRRLDFYGDSTAK